MTLQCPGVGGRGRSPLIIGMFIIVYVILCVYIYVHKYRMGGSFLTKTPTLKPPRPKTCCWVFRSLCNQCPKMTETFGLASVSTFDPDPPVGPAPQRPIRKCPAKCGTSSNEGLGFAPPKVPFESGKCTKFRVQYPGTP
jgi:hypothetical protein